MLLSQQDLIKMSKELKISLLLTTVIFVVSFIALFQFRRRTPGKIGRVLDVEVNPIANSYVALTPRVVTSGL